MTTDATHAGLIGAICHDPADDVPRLVLADWLDDHGDPVRAEFIRAGITMARHGDCPTLIHDRH